jgi:hypothetical protein
MEETRRGDTLSFDVFFCSLGDTLYLIGILLLNLPLRLYNGEEEKGLTRTHGHTKREKHTGTKYLVRLVCPFKDWSFR